MGNFAKLLSVIAFSAIILASSLSGVNAFQLLEPAGSAEANSRSAATAFADEGAGSALQKASILSPTEIRHIEWCAAQYTFAYDPVSDTYRGKSGVRLQCVSPR